MNEASLSNLRDIVLPAEPGLWPLAPGLWLLVGFVVSASLLSALYLYQRRRRNAYRRAGLLLLQDVRSLHELSVLLKRVALAAFPRETVASLHGEAWLSFLATTCPGADLSGLTASPETGEAGDSLKQSAALWIRNHRVEARNVSEESR